jgi:hypothetical protein
MCGGHAGCRPHCHDHAGHNAFPPHHHDRGCDFLFDSVRRHIHESLWRCLCDYCRPPCFDPCRGPRYIAGCNDPYDGYFIQSCGCRRRF